jgi:uncharacterized protein
MKIFSFTLVPDQDLQTEIEHFAKVNKIADGFVLTGVGSLKHASLRMADAQLGKQDIRIIDGPLEITSFEGIISEKNCHIHMTVSDKNGKVTGGHLKKNSSIYLMAKIVIGVNND